MNQGSLFRGAWPYRTMLAVLVLAPLPYGGNRPLAWSLLAAVMGLCLVGWAIDAGRNRRLLFWPSGFGIVVGLMALVLAWIVAGLVPGAFWADHTWDQARVALGRPVIASGSIEPDAGWDNLIRLSSYVGMFWLAMQYGRKPDRALEVLRTVGVSGSVYAIYGLFTYADDRYVLPWMREYAALREISGPFVNRNHFATFEGLACFANLGLALSAFRQRWNNAGYLHSKVLRVLSSITNRSALYLLCASACLMALLQSHSRMGFLAFVVALGTGTVLLALIGMLSSARRSVAGIALCMLAFFYLSGSATLERLSATGAVDRGPIFDMSMNALARRPWTGFGYGAFAPALQQVRIGGFRPSYNITEAHNVYLQLAVELGIPAALALVAVVASLIGYCVWGAFHRRRDRIFPVVAVSAGTLVGVHGLVDFSVQIPAVALVFSALLGLGVAQSWSNRAYFETTPSERKAKFA